MHEGVFISMVCLITVLYNCSTLNPPLVSLDHQLLCYEYDLTVATTLLLPVRIDLLGLYLQLPGLSLQLPGLKPRCSYATDNWVDFLSTNLIA